MAAPTIVYGNLGLGEVALVGIAVLYLFGFSGGRALRLQADAPSARRGRQGILVAALGGGLLGWLTAFLGASVHVGNVVLAIAFAVTLAFLVVSRPSLASVESDQWVWRLIAASVFLLSWGFVAGFAA